MTRTDDEPWAAPPATRPEGEWGRRSRRRGDYFFLPPFFFFLSLSFLSFFFAMINTSCSPSGLFQDTLKHRSCPSSIGSTAGSLEPRPQPAAALVANSVLYVVLRSTLSALPFTFGLNWLSTVRTFFAPASSITPVRLNIPLLASIAAA